MSCPGGGSPSRSASATARLGQRAHARADAALAHLERQLHAAHLAGLGQQALDRELEVVDLLEREVHALGDAADDQPDHGLEVARQGRLEVDALVMVASTRFSDGSLAHDAILAHQAGQLPRCDSVRGLVELELEAFRRPGRAPGTLAARRDSEAGRSRPASARAVEGGVLQRHPAWWRAPPSGPTTTRFELGVALQHVQRL